MSTVCKPHDAYDAERLAETLGDLIDFDDEVRGDVRRCDSFAEAGVMTNNHGLVIRFKDGSEFQVTVVQSRGPSPDYLDADGTLEDVEAEPAAKCPGCGEGPINRHTGACDTCSDGSYDRAAGDSFSATLTEGGA
jgi:hypothetical protein